MADFDSGWAKVIVRNDEHTGRVGRYIGDDFTGSTQWITLEMDGEEIMFERKEVIPCPPPEGS